MNRRASTLLLTLIFMVGLIGVTVAYITLVTYDTKNIGGQENNVKAFYLAEAALNKAIWYLLNTAPDSSTDGSWRTTAYPADPGAGADDPKQEVLGDGTYTLWVETSGSDILITGRGTINGIERIVRQTISYNAASTLPEAFSYAVFVGGDIQIDSTHNGTIDGDIGARGEISDAGVTVTGNSEENSDVEFPDIDYAEYENIADNVVNGNKTFAKNTTSSGIWYIKGDVAIAQNAVINGTIIAEGDVSFSGNGGTVTASSPYPAIVAQGNISTGGNNNVSISGALVTEGNIEAGSSNNFIFVGSIVVQGNLEMSDSNNFDITFTETDPPFFSDSQSGGGGAPGVTSISGSWGEV